MSWSTQEKLEQRTGRPQHNAPRYDVRPSTPVCARTHTQTRTCTPRDSHTHTHTCINTHTRTDAHWRMHTHIHTQAHAHTYMHRHTHPCIHTHPHTHTHAHRHTHTDSPHPPPHKNKHPSTDTHTHPPTHTYTPPTHPCTNTPLTHTHPLTWHGGTPPRWRQSRRRAGTSLGWRCGAGQTCRARGWLAALTRMGTHASTAAGRRGTGRWPPPRKIWRWWRTLKAESHAVYFLCHCQVMIRFCHCSPPPPPPPHTHTQPISLMGEWGLQEVGEEGDYSYRYTVTARLTPPEFRRAVMRAVLTFH